MRKMTSFIAVFLGGIHMSLAASQFIGADHPYIQYYGRWDFTDPAKPAHSWPGVYLELGFTGTSIGIRMTDAVNYYNIYIDGKQTGILHGNSKEASDYSVAENLTDSTHTLRLSKRNTSFDQVFTISGFLLDDGASMRQPPAPPALKIEFLGDSFTAAEGNEATEQQMPWEAKMPFTNIDQGFAPVIARHFGAQYATTCRPGIGMACDWQGKRDQVLSLRFDRALMDVEDPKWDFTQWIPDLAVIILGLNDYSGAGGWNGPVSAQNSEIFRKHYHAFIGRIRTVYPGVRILAVAAQVPWIRENVNQVVAEEKMEGHEDIRYAQFDEFEGGYVANGHPTVETHHKIAGQLIQVIESEQWIESD